tara:strand:- start:4561 stop:5241 length:681 start_codon:yes stop_codon:yes gene_type:complete
MKIDKNNRSLVNILGAPLTIFCIYYSQITFIFFISITLFFSFYEFINLLKNKSKNNFKNIFMGFLWISSLSSFILLYEKYSSNIIFIIFISIWVTDSMAYIMGKNFGKRKILPSISPNKTWIGSISGLASTMIFLFYFYYNSSIIPNMKIAPFTEPSFNHYDFIVISLIIGFFSQFGDFFESFFKRKLNVKDSSSLLLGHGGFLDRFDSFYFVGTVLYLYLLFRGI